MHKCGSVILLLLVGGIGCAGPAASNQSAQTGATTSPTERSTAMLLDPILAETLEIREQNLRREGGNIAVAETKLTNRSKSDLWIDLRCLFKDGFGMTVETSPWKTLMLSGKASSTYAAPTLNPFASRFIVEIRSAAPDRETRAPSAPSTQATPALRGSTPTPR